MQHNSSTRRRSQGIGCLKFWQLTELLRIRLNWHLNLDFDSNYYSILYFFFRRRMMKSCSMHIISWICKVTVMYERICFFKSLNYFYDHKTKYYYVFFPHYYTQMKKSQIQRCLTENHSKINSITNSKTPIACRLLPISQFGYGSSEKS